ncbi:disA bacterial checkpoint controller nucleotide-binding domain-containing protein [Ditylenchus destructor]|nr:disA bacterial checkpoint controller nucleotide-binding domain-containing protein [Ditylenchus destructor]
MPIMEYVPPLVQGQTGIASHGYFSVDFAETMFLFADNKIGATVIINPHLNPDSDSMLQDRASGGTPLNEPYSSDRLYNIFRDKSNPMSNGAVVVNLFPERTIHSGDAPSLLKN